MEKRSVLSAILAGLGLQTLFFALRWERLGHGPFNSMFEILASNVWSLLLVFAIAYWRIRAIRPSAALVMPLMFVMIGWLIVASPHDTQIPPTYDTVWLYIHIGLGKVFLGATLFARRQGHGLDQDVLLDPLGIQLQVLQLVAKGLTPRRSHVQAGLQEPAQAATLAAADAPIVASRLGLRDEGECFIVADLPALAAAAAPAVGIGHALA